MKTIFKCALITLVLFLLLISDVPLLIRDLVPEAHAIFGVRRRTAVRTAVVVGSAASAQTAAANQQAAAANQQAAAAQQEAAAAKQEAAAAKEEAATAKQQAAATPPPAAAGEPLPLGTVVAALPGGCTSTPVGGVQYYYCGGNFYRAAYQGNMLVYVTAKP